MAPTWRYASCVVVAAMAVGPAGRGGAEATTARKSDEERRAEYERFVDKMMDAMPAEELAQELVGVIHRTMDSERRQRRKRELERDFDTNDEALLERIGRLVVQWVNTRLTPRTDDHCSWNWGRWRCDPQCDCEYKYRFGDYTPGRSCRLRPEEDRGLPTCNPNRGNDVSLLEKLATFVGKAAKGAWRFTADNVIPQTDEGCRFSLAHSLDERKPVCAPRKRCAFRYKFGDVHPGRACRLRSLGDEHGYAKGLERASGGGGRRAGVNDGSDWSSSGSSGSSGGDEGGGEGWSMFDWGDGGGSDGDAEDYDDDDDDDGLDNGPWATRGRVWRSGDGDDSARGEL